MTAKVPLKVHLRLRFQNPGKPALRGFVAERAPIRGTSLYLVIFSNGPHRSKNPPVKFGFSLKTVPTNIAKKLPPQRCSNPLFIAFFSLSHKRPTFAFTPESGYTLAFRKKIAHKGTHGETGGVLGGGGITTLGAFHTVRKPCVAGCQNGVFCRFWGLVVGAPKNAESLRDSDALMRVAVPRRRGPAGLRNLFLFC